MILHRVIALSAALALSACGSSAPEEPAHDFTAAPDAVAEALAEQVGAPYTVMVDRPNEWGWICGSVQTPGKESRFFIWDGHQLTVQPETSDDMTPEQGVALASFMIAREGCLP